MIIVSQIVLARLGISFKDLVTESYMSKVELREPNLIVANALDSKYFSCVTPSTIPPALLVYNWIAIVQHNLNCMRVCFGTEYKHYVSAQMQHRRDQSVHPNQCSVHACV